MSKYLYRYLTVNIMAMAVLLAACSSEGDEACPGGQMSVVEVSFAPSMETGGATRGMTTVMGEQWEHEINDLWVLLVKKNTAGRWTLRYKFHFEKGVAMDASPLTTEGGLVQTSATLPLRYATSAKTIEAGNYYPLYLANVPTGSALEDALQQVVVSDATLDGFLKTLLTAPTGTAGMPSPVAFELRDKSAASTVRLLATNAFRMDAVTGLPVGQWPGFDAAQPVSLMASGVVDVTLYRSVAKLRLFLRTTEKDGTYISTAGGFTLQSLSILHVPTHGFLVWNTQTPTGETSPAGAFGGYVAPDNGLQDVALNVSQLPLLAPIHTTPVSASNLLDGTKAGLNCYLKADAEMVWSSALPGVRRTPATVVQLVMKRGSTQSFTYQIPILPSSDPYPYLMGNRCYDLHLCFRGPAKGFEVAYPSWVDTGEEELLFQ